MSESDLRLRTTGHTPLQRQYLRLKAEMYPAGILFLRVGDFYEVLFEDAMEVSRVTGNAVTRLNGVLMCGVHRMKLDNALAEMVRAGFNVGIGEEMEWVTATGIPQPIPRGALIRREVTRVIVAGNNE